MHKDIQNIRENQKKKKKISSPWHLLSLRRCCFITQFPFRSTTTKQKCTNEKENNKNTSNMRSHNKVIQVRCVEIKLKVNNNNNNINNNNKRQQQGTSETKHRDTTTHAERKRGLIYSVVLLVAPWAAGPCLVPSVIFPPFSTAHFFFFELKKNNPKTNKHAWPPSGHAATRSDAH